MPNKILWETTGSSIKVRFIDDKPWGLKPNKLKLNFTRFSTSSELIEILWPLTRRTKEYLVKMKTLFELNHLKCINWSNQIICFLVCGPSKWGLFLIFLVQSKWILTSDIRMSVTCFVTSHLRYITDHVSSTNNNDSDSVHMCPVSSFMKTRLHVLFRTWRVHCDLFFQRWSLRAVFREMAALQHEGSI